MLHPDTEARTDPQLRLPPRAERGAERARQSRQRWRWIATLAGVTLLLMALGIGRAWAWTATASGSCDCDGTTFLVNYGDEPGTHTANLTFDGETKTQTVNAEGGGTITLHFASHDGGPWSYEGTWSESSEVETASGTLPAVTDCEQEETPTPTTAPPVTQPPAEEKPPADKDDDFAGTATDQSRTPPHGPPTKAAPPVAAPPPGELPFTGPEHPFGMNDLQWAAFLVSLGLFASGALMVLGGRRRYQQLSLVEKAVDRAMHKPYRGPHEPV